ncbi:glycoside hydrolase family 43 protein [Fodinibius salsisoli]|uniref:Glycoside hydrolase family 43 protein n=1 Tax=Fodinibius salsisoli TaxID=2820877 RepID=A0ABT3PMF7_9BACT|nr:glycoside hydrolase family 43 protein [Fodinibius salsisoli]MCW9706344.1 glycoside hydrolase family 43 protein [Fodinibius salsisoli]
MFSRSFIPFCRRILLVFALLFLVMCSSKPNEEQQLQESTDSTAKDQIVSQISYTNPLILQRADPWVYRHTDGYYYFIASVPEFDRLELRRAKTIEGLKEAEPKVIWRKHETGPMGAHIWAPELHYIDGKWYIYFAAGGAEDIWNIRMYVVENDSKNPLNGEWVEKDETKTKWDTFSLDATTFEHQGTRYMVWAQHPPEYDGNTALYIAEMENPWTIKQPQVELTRPEYDWEEQLFKVNEGAAVIKNDGKIFMTYSASGTDHNYAVGLLTADVDADLLDPKSWTKAEEPVFKSSPENGIYGPGHNSFTTTPDGSTDLFIYHARSYKEIDGNPLNDPNRHTRVQVLRWAEDGTPIFGKPLPDNVPTDSTKR